MVKDHILTPKGFSFKKGSDPLGVDSYRSKLLDPTYYRLSQVVDTAIPKTEAIAKVGAGTRLQRFETNIRVIFEAVFFFSELWGHEHFWIWLVKCLKMWDLSWKSEALEKVVSCYCEARRSYRSKTGDSLALSPPTPVATLVDMIIKVHSSRPTPPSRSLAHVQSTLSSLKRDWPKRLRKVLDSMKLQPVESQSYIKQEDSQVPYSSTLHGVPPTAPTVNRAAPPRSTLSRSRGSHNVESSASEDESEESDPAHPIRCSSSKEERPISPDNCEDEDGSDSEDGSDDDDFTDGSDDHSPPSVPAANEASLPTITHPAQEPLISQSLRQVESSVDDENHEKAALSGRHSDSAVQLVGTAQENTALTTTSDDETTDDDNSDDYSPALPVDHQSGGANKRKATAAGLHDGRSPKRFAGDSNEQTVEVYGTDPLENADSEMKAVSGDSGDSDTSDSYSQRSDSDCEDSSADENASNIPNCAKATTKPDTIVNASETPADEAIGIGTVGLIKRAPQLDGRVAITEQVEARLAIAKVARLETLVKHLHNETMASFRSQSDTTMASLNSVEERLLQLERNQSSADQHEAENKQLQSKIQQHAQSAGAPASPSSFSSPYPMLPSGSEHLNYLMSRDVKPFLDGAGDEIRKVRSVLLAKLKQQDCSNEGWTKQSYLSDVIWQLDRAIEKARKGVTAL